jgi:hypothetical protein
MKILFALLCAKLLLLLSNDVLLKIVFMAVSCMLSFLTLAYS